MWAPGQGERDVGTDALTSGKRAGNPAEGNQAAKHGGVSNGGVGARATTDASCHLGVGGTSASAAPLPASVCGRGGGEAKNCRERAPPYSGCAGGHCEENCSALTRLSAFVLPISLHALADQSWTSDTHLSSYTRARPVGYDIKHVLNRSANDVSDSEPIPAALE